MPHLSPINWLLVSLTTWLLIMVIHLMLFHKQPLLEPSSQAISKLPNHFTPWH